MGRLTNSLANACPALCSPRQGVSPSKRVAARVEKPIGEKDGAANSFIPAGPPCRLCPGSTRISPNWNIPRNPEFCISLCIKIRGLRETEWEGEMISFLRASCSRLANVARGLKFNRKFIAPFAGSTREEFQQGSSDGLQPRLLPATGLREQDAHGSPFQQTIRYVRPAGPQDH
ncbi:hypothetical protein K0M31_020099, partial [Melipona bicolor]